MTIQKEIVSALIDKGVVVTPDLFEKIKDKEYSEIIKTIDEIKGINQRIVQEHGKKGYSFIFNHEKKDVNKTVEDFILYFNVRYKNIENILKNRIELQGATSLKRIAQKSEKEAVSIIGMVKNIAETKNNNIIITVEDPTGEIKVVIQRTKKEVFEAARTLTLDEIIGVVGVLGKGAIFGEKIIWPDIPITHEFKKAPAEEYALFLSDLHVGSKQFLGNLFEKFLKWINGELGDEKQKALVKKIKYLFIIGDIVDGVSVYPGQENDLEILDIYKQYSLCAQLLKQIPDYITIIICPGNHDAMRLAEPQLPLPEDIAGPLYELKNVFMVSNPAMINIGQNNGFQGISVLLYHGYSFDYYIANIDTIRNKGGYDRPDLVMKFLLQRRHLAPTHTSSLYIPYTDEDPLVISKIPDIFASGHLHKTSVSQYRNITLICGSCWQGKTPFQEKMGHNPEPGRVPVVNLQTREIKIIKFIE